MNYANIIFSIFPKSLTQGSSHKLPHCNENYDIKTKLIGIRVEFGKDGINFNPITFYEHHWALNNWPIETDTGSKFAGYCVVHLSKLKFKDVVRYRGL